MEAFNIGDVILGKYKVTRILGKGGMGTLDQREIIHFGGFACGLIPARITRLTDASVRAMRGEAHES